MNRSFVPDYETENDENQVPIDLQDMMIDNDENRNTMMDTEMDDIYDHEPCSVATDYEGVEDMEDDVPNSIDDEREHIFDKPHAHFPENEHKYQSEGRIFMEIDAFDDFVRGPPETQQRLSKPVYVRGLPWRILALPRLETPRDQAKTARPQKHLGYFLQCNGDSESTVWNCVATAHLSVCVLGQDGTDYTRRISHTFYPKENDWGFSQFIPCDLLNEKNGYLKDNKVRLSCLIQADAPHGVQWDSKRHSGYVGLKNQGATCYMNSILQTFFFCSKFRKAVYEMPTCNDSDDNSVALALQRVFYDLQHSDRPVGTKKLTKSFGWDSLDSFLQHDAQELCRVLLDNLENKMKGTAVSDFIPQLFRGTMKSFINCLSVNFASVREEPFYDISLNVKGKCDILESFREYVEIERLDGDNKYDAGPMYGHQPAEKGVVFMQLPPVLHLHLMRFQYDPQLDANVKINDRFEFYDRLDLNEFVDDKAKKIDNVYHLHAVLVHSGDFNGGHYVVFINTNLRSPREKASPKWCKFDDDVVSPASIRDAINSNYGGEDIESPGRSYTSAYMLVYIREDVIDTTLFDFTDADIPKPIRIRFENEKSEENKRKKEKLEAHLYMEIIVMHESTLLRHHGFDLLDIRSVEDDLQREKVEKKMTINELYKFVAKKWAPQSKSCGYFHDGSYSFPVMPFRLWRFEETTWKDEVSPAGSLPRFRPSVHLNYGADGLTRTLEHALDGERSLLFIEGPDEFLTSYDDNRDMLVFVKYYDGKLKELITLGHQILCYRRRLEEYFNHFRGMAHLSLKEPIRVYEEISPDRVRQIDTDIPTCVENSFLEITDGGVLIFESKLKTSGANNAKHYLESIYNTIEVDIQMSPDNFLPGSRQLETSIFSTVAMTWPCDKLAAFIADSIGHNKDRILLWKLSPYNEKPQQFVTGNHHKTMTVKELLGLQTNQSHDPRRSKRYKLVYSKVRMNPLDMDTRRQMKVQVMDEKFNVEEMTVFPDKSGTVADILDEVQHEFPFGENGSGKLRLVYVGHSAHTLRVYNRFEESTPVVEVLQKLVSPAMFMVRVEEIPEDQMIVRPNEYLLPVSHFDKEPARMFGIPFLFKVFNDELLTTVHGRLQKYLGIPDKEYEKYKFALISNGRVIRYLDMEKGNRVNLAELGHTHLLNSGAMAPFLGIDHPNKKHVRPMQNAEKAIVIHN
ncbi:unnamed protein product [Auanema sp. JU1783]|nr:unnamed protein product [Auanema sp. JU1783]